MINLRNLKTDVLRGLPDALRLTRTALIPLAFMCVVAVDTAIQAQVVGGTDPTTILTAITTFILGPFGQALAVLGLIAAGVTFMFGRLGLLHLGAFVAGLVLVFGASFLVQQFLGGAV
jgi:type IV secretory pathway VirB2 component (pilin)